jgi:hypothetical protein
MLSPLVSSAFFSASGLSARKLLGLAASIHCCTAKRMRARVLASPSTLSAICISARAFSRYICAVIAAAGLVCHSLAAKRLSADLLVGAAAVLSAPWSDWFHISVAFLM